MEKILLIYIIVFVAAEFIISSVLSSLNRSWMSHPIPNVLKGIYDSNTYAKQQRYARECDRIGWIDRVFSFILTIIVLVTGLLGWLNDAVCVPAFTNPLWQLILFLVIAQTVLTLIGIPFSYYSTFVVEQRYGFNKTTHRTFWADTAKSFALSIVLSSVLIGVIFLLYQTWRDDFWIYALAVCVAVMIFFSMFYSNLIVPLFNKQTPLEPGELRSAIEIAVKSAGFSIKDIYVINGSKHSTKANAYFTGLGRTKRVVLYDTLIQQLTTEEIVAVLGHELGHYSHHDTWKMLGFNIVYIAVNFYVFSLLVSNPALPKALGGTQWSFALALVAFSLLFTPIDIILKPIINWASRINEYYADAFAVECGYGKELISGLKKLHANSLSNLTPHPLYIKFHFSHPSLEQRVIAIQDYDRELSQPDDAEYGHYGDDDKK
jgi:STE24 endopeptidase